MVFQYFLNNKIFFEGFVAANRNIKAVKNKQIFFNSIKKTLFAPITLATKQLEKQGVNNIIMKTVKKEID